MPKITCGLRMPACTLSARPEASGFWNIASADGALHTRQISIRSGVRLKTICEARNFLHTLEHEHLFEWHKIETHKKLSNHNNKIPNNRTRARVLTVQTLLAVFFGS